MEERLKALRKELKLTQEEFAKKLNIKRGAIANYEIGRNTPIDAVISLICKTFAVNEEWLRTGNGEMFVTQSPKDELSLLLADVQNRPDDDFKTRLIIGLAKLSDEDLKVIEKFMYSIIAERKE